MRLPVACCLATLLAACATPAHDAGPAAPPAPTSTPTVQVPQIVRPDGENAQWWFRSGAAAAAERGAMAGTAR
ncbi:MAG: alkaline phosphatase, partial [Gammaproteobacteria bacterium]|nr:alkaline phosphatase [Gammaproteobacteria bacterium]